MRSAGPSAVSLTLSAVLITSCSSPLPPAPINPEDVFPAEMDARIARIHDRFVFADMHAHPSRFHRANVDMISAEEILLYRRRHMDIVVANVSSDAAYDGGYTRRDGTRVPRTGTDAGPGDGIAFTLDRLDRILASIKAGYAVRADNPDTVLAARRRGEVSLLLALEGADGLEGKIENLRSLHDHGLRLLQLVHFRLNGLGRIQTAPYEEGGLTEFGKEVVRECNRLGIIIDMAHANTETILDTLALSEHPVLFSHGGLKALHEQDRALTDDEVRAIATAGGVVGIWPNGSSVESVAQMVDYIEHVIALAGANHVGIGSDLRGMGSYSDGFGEDAEFRAIAAELLDRGHSDEAVGKIMGGNFFRVWRTVTGS